MDNDNAYTIGLFDVPFQAAKEIQTSIRDFGNTLLSHDNQWRELLLVSLAFLFSWTFMRAVKNI